MQHTHGVYDSSVIVLLALWSVRLRLFMAQSNRVVKKAEQTCRLRSLRRDRACLFLSPRSRRSLFTHPVIKARNSPGAAGGASRPTILLQCDWGPTKLGNALQPLAVYGAEQSRRQEGGANL